MRVVAVPALLIGLWLPATEEPGRPEITVYVAASLRDAMEKLTPVCEEATGTRLVFNFGASNDLERQIEAANKADVFFSADQSWMDRLEQAGMVDGDSRRAPLSNRLVVVAPRDSAIAIHSAADLAATKTKWIALANPEVVPAGKYAKAWLENAGQWQVVRDRVLPGVDVRAALASVESGAAELGVVYLTDAAISGKVRVLYEVPEAEGPRIAYALAAIRGRPLLDQARRVTGCLTGSDAAAVYEKLGFVVLLGEMGR